MKRVLLCLFVVPILWGAAQLRGEPASPAVSVPAIGQVVGDFTLKTNYGREWTLSESSDKSVIAIVFLGTECPLAKLYGPRLQQLQDEFEDRGVQFVGINSNSQDSLTELTGYVQRHQIKFPMLKDIGNVVADAMDARRTPEAFVLDQDRKIRYHGRIDDQYGVGYSRDKVVHGELSDAIEDLLAGREVAKPQSKPIGCHIGRVKKNAVSGSVTYTRDVAPILNARCVSCHREGEIAPFTLTSYDDILGWEDTIMEVIDDGRMPPWSANPAHGRFANDARLTQQEKDTVFAWIDGGMPKGDLADLPAPPEFTDGWQIPKPDQVLTMRDDPFQVPAEGVVDYQRFIVDPGWETDKYIVAAEARPENRSVVHHIVVYVLEPGARRTDLRKVLAAYAPGSPPLVLPEGVAMKIRAGSKLLFEMHYTPNGTACTDLSYAGVSFTDADSVEREMQGQVAINHRFRIPPQAKQHEVIAHYGSRRDQLLISMSPHMHLRGSAFRYEARYPDGDTEILLDVPQYDFNWQLKYVLETPKLLPKGTVVTCTATYDNSPENLTNPDPTRTVSWGDQSWDEMMIGFMEFIPPKS
ncbi:MAG: redoxin domain-containing protein [Planctomycetota bacterium]